MNKPFKLYQQVVLSRDLPDENLQKGDVATIVEIVENNNNTGYCLELFDNNGNTLKVVVISQSDISEVMPHSIVNYRPLETY